MFLLRWCSTVVKWITFLFITVGGIDHRNNEAVEFEVCHADEFVLGENDNPMELGNAFCFEKLQIPILVIYSYDC